MTSALFHAFASAAKPEADFVNIVRGEGSLVWDDSGKDYGDGLGSLWYCQVGHGRAEIIDAVAIVVPDRNPEAPAAQPQAQALSRIGKAQAAEVLKEPAAGTTLRIFKCRPIGCEHIEISICVKIKEGKTATLHLEDLPRRCSPRGQDQVEPGIGGIELAHPDPCFTRRGNRQGPGIGAAGQEEGGCQHREISAECSSHPPAPLRISGCSLSAACAASLSPSLKRTLESL